MTPLDRPRTFAYNTDLKLNQESLGAFYNYANLDSTYDSIGRSTGYNFATTAGTKESLTAGFEPATGRILNFTGSVNDSIGNYSATFTFGYNSGTDIVGSVTSGSFSRSTPLAAQQDVIAESKTSWGGTVKADFTGSFSDPRGLLHTWTSDSSGSDAWSTRVGLGDGIVSTLSYDGVRELTGALPSWYDGIQGSASSLSAHSYG